MCGIAGAAAREADRGAGTATLRMTRALAHRGPDGEGFWARDADGAGLRSAEELGAPALLVLGHRRLSIVDLEGGAQPMSDGAGEVWVSFNGEIYNHLELRRELERSGHRFATNADTEVLIHGWKEWGEDLFGRLNGIFAFALVDSKQDVTVLVRDPVGVKPLYVGIRGEMTWWSSELSAAIASDLVRGPVSPAALKLFLTFRFIPSPHTIYRDVWKLPPGTFVRLRSSEIGRPPRFVRYDTVIRSTASPRTRPEWSEALFAELDGAVDRQLMADVPVSALLSGGVDSSLVTRMMRSHLGEPPATFGIGFGEYSDQNEAAFAQAAARELAVPHHSTVVSDQRYLGAWPDAVAELGEPIANTGALLVRLICEEIGRTHKVTLSGQGADEPLGGYPRHLIERVHGYARHAERLSRAITARTFGGENGDRLVRALEAPDRLGRYVEIFSVMPGHLVDALVPDEDTAATELAREAIARWISPHDPADSVNEFLYIDARLSLADDLLIIGDLFSMRSSVELRVPFLDLQLLDLVERMPSKYKISPLGAQKWLYRRGALDRLPPGLAARLRSHGRFARGFGFSTPREWFEDGRAAERFRPRDAIAALPLRSDLLAEVTEAVGPRQRALIETLRMWSDAYGSVEPVADREGAA